MNTILDEALEAVRKNDPVWFFQLKAVRKGGASDAEVWKRIDDAKGSSRQSRQRALAAVNALVCEHRAKDLTPCQVLSEARRAAAAKSHESRWGAARGASKQIRVSHEAFAALQGLPEKVRNSVASEAVLAAVRSYAK